MNGIINTILSIILLFSISYSSEQFKIPKLSNPPKIDGKIQENSEWKEAIKIENFLQLTPKEGGAPSERTFFYIGYDKENLYMAFKCFDSEPRKIRATLTQRDRVFSDDWVLILIDTFNEKRRAFAFFVNPFGIQMDGISIEEGGSQNFDFSWDAVFYSEGRITREGYEIEVSIPFKSIRFPNKNEHRWGLFIGRNIPRKPELITYPAISRNTPSLLIQSSEIIIEGEIERGRNIEIMPVFTSIKRSEEKIDPEAGINFKYGISSNIIMDFTFNPDFSHIEADSPQIDVNQRYALYWPEKRPFFLEGSEIFNHPSINIVYTRRIIDPRWGGKITGKAGKFTFGYISALDINPTESLWEITEKEGGGGEKALFNVFRAKMDLWKEAYLGFTFTDKEIDGLYNRVVGLDGQLKFRNNFYLVYQAILSNTFLGEKRSINKPAYFLNAFYNSKYLSGGFSYKAVHSEFEALAGFVNRTDYQRGEGWISLSLYPEKKYLSQVSTFLKYQKYYDYNLDNPIEDALTSQIDFRIGDFNSLSVYFINSMEKYENINFRKKYGGLQLSTYLIKWVEIEGGVRLGESIFYDPENPYLGWFFSGYIWTQFKPFDRLRFDLSFQKYRFLKERKGELVLDYDVLRMKTEYQFHKNLSARFIIDYNHFYKKIYGNFLLSWILKPGIVFFVGYDTNYEQMDSLYKKSSGSIFFKFSYWWRI
ncbi:MAG: DUF5916 domain-containing protein [Candidatus Aminicenantia bacterium]